MKPYLSVGLLLLVLSPTMGAAAGNRVQPLPSDAPATVMPSPAELSDSRSTARLRDTLRQPHEEAEDDKPYRMPAQERQRMREQLRSQTFYDTTKK